MNLNKALKFLAPLLLPLLLFGQNPGIRLQHLGVADGLSTSRINVTYQDSRGYLWFGTNDGLNRYDGHEMLVYKYDPDDKKSINDNYIHCLVEDAYSRLWIGTDGGGLAYRDLKTGKFHKVYLGDAHSKKRLQHQVWDFHIDDRDHLIIATWDGVYKIDLSQPGFGAKRISTETIKVRDVLKDSSNRLWIGTEDQGLYRPLEKDTKQLLSISETANLRIYCIKTNGDDRLWVGTKTGILELNTETGGIRNLELLSGENDIEVTSMILEKDSILWIGTVKHGLLTFDIATGAVNQFSPNEQDPYGLSSSGILNLFIDKQGILWVATRGDGVQYFKTETQFNYYGSQEPTENYLSDPSIRAIIANDKELWIGGYGGLDRFSKTGQRKMHWGGKGEGLSNRNVYALLLDTDSTLWAGTEGGGLFNKPKQEASFSQVIIETKKDLAADHIFELYQATHGSIYIGTGAGLYVFDPKKYGPKSKNIFRSKKMDRSLDGERITAIIEGSDNNLFVGTGSEGLYVLDSTHQVIVNYNHNPDDRTSLSSDRIKVLYFDNEGLLWVGTDGGGLDKFDPLKGIFYHYNQNDGLPDNTIYGILEDEDKHLWLSSNKGITRFNKKDFSIQSFGIEHGLQHREFNTAAYYKSDQGEMFFGGISGLNVFKPEAVRSLNRSPKVTLTDFRVSNQSILPGTGILPLDINIVNELSLSHREDIISLHFSGMDFLAPEKSRFRYKVTGIDKYWVNAGPGARSATYTHLPSGRREFLVQVSTEPGLDYGETRRLKLNIKPAPWLSWWAYLTYTILLLMMFYLIRINELKKISLKAELDHRKMDGQKLNEIETMRSRLISNVSNELRIPLTLVGGQIEKLFSGTRSKLSTKDRELLKNAQSSLKQLTNISDQLFDLSQITTGKINLNVEQQNLSEVLRGAVQEFNGAEKGHHFICNTPEKPVAAYLDKTKFEQILITLLKNALTFAHKDSEIVTDLIEEGLEDERGTGSFAMVRVHYKGQGISKKGLNHVFERLYEIDTAEGNKKPGTGLGLALAKELVELHGGSISVDSVEGISTTFEFTIPRGSAHLYQEEILTETLKTEKPYVPSGLSDPTLKKVLVVEDEDSLRSFICQALEDEFAISLAEDGEEAYQIAELDIPDVIISDIYMPKKDGFELLRDIRNNPKLSHVPLILLTGQDITNNRLRSYKELANGFMTKPFTVEELKLRINNIFDERTKIANKMTERGGRDIVTATPLSEVDEKLIFSIKQVLELRLKESELNVEALAKEMFMSKRQLERKLKEITGQSPAEFIRQARLYRGRQFLLDGSHATVGEIAYAVGFKNVKYFSRLYRNQFGESPTEALKT